jgi:hypothetical protein
MCAVLTMFGRATPVYAAEEDRSGPADRLDRLERSVNELAQRQEQLMRQLGAAQERQGPMMAPGRENCRPPMAGSGRPGIGQPMPPMGGPPEMGFPAPGAPPVLPARGGKDLGGLVALFLLVVLAFNILVAVWINSDIRKRGEGSGIFIALALLAGVPAAIIYALVRLGDKRT